MALNKIKLDDLELDASLGVPISIQAKFSPGILAGIDLNFSVNRDESILKIEDIFQRPEVEVNDPYIGRVYKATVKRTFLSYQENRPERSYKAEVREIDIPPKITHLEINGFEFEVIIYSEREDSNHEIRRHAVLKLSEAEFRQLVSMAKEDRAQIRRVHIDATPIELTLRGMNWSMHEHEGEIFRKLSVNLYPVRDKENKSWSDKLGLLMNIRPQNLERQLLILSARYERLVELLVEKGVLSQTEKENLFVQDWGNNNDRIEELKLEFRRVDDAEELAD